VGLVFTSSDFLYPQVRAVLEPLGKWKKIGEPGHVILGGVDGDLRAARWMKEGYVDATGVQDLFVEADELLKTLLEAMNGGQKTPERWMEDPGFALTQSNIAERANDSGASVAGRAERRRSIMAVTRVHRVLFQAGRLSRLPAHPALRELVLYLSSFCRLLPVHAVHRQRRNLANISSNMWPLLAWCSARCLS
jgi:inositol transport system substrate-binding protein